MRYRHEKTLQFWPPSPEYTGGDDRSHSPSRDHKKRSREDESDESDDSDSERGRSSKSRSDKRKSKHKSSSSSSKRKKKKSSSSSKKKKHRRRASSSESASESSDDSDDDDRREHAIETTTAKDEGAKTAAAEPHEAAPSDAPDPNVVGPLPLPEERSLDERSYGGALLAGEGSAMAAYVQQGKRIPRRGEIGLTGDEIKTYEDVGYVMSGSRHQRMNAVRMRKENQVISAEEKRELLKFQQEEKNKKEAQILADFKEMVDVKVEMARAKVRGASSSSVDPPTRSSASSSSRK
ncbi:hypothetical protein RI367_003962 [Sorochytrium milnesiophthora]